MVNAVDIKLESSEAYLLKLEKKLSQGFENIDICCKNVVLNICRYFKLFYTYKKINNSFLKFDHSLLIKGAKNHRNRLNHFCRKTRFKNITNAHINRIGPP